MIPTASRPMVRGCFRLFQAVSKRGETDKLLITLMKIARCFAVSPFLGNAAREILMGTDRPIKIPGGLIPENRETAKQTAIYHEISMACLFQPV